MPWSWARSRCRDCALSRRSGGTATISSSRGNSGRAHGKWNNRAKLLQFAQGADEQRTGKSSVYLRGGRARLSGARIASAGDKPGDASSPGQLVKRAAARWRALAASTSRSLGRADVTNSSTKRPEASATALTARSNASALARDGSVHPLILRTYCNAAPRSSSWVAGGSKLYRGRMLRHMREIVQSG